MCHVPCFPVPCVRVPCAHITSSVCPRIHEFMRHIALHPEPLSPPCATQPFPAPQQHHGCGKPPHAAPYRDRAGHAEGARLSDMGHAEILMELTFQLPFICTGSGGREGAGAASLPYSPPPSMLSPRHSCCAGSFYWFSSLLTLPTMNLEVNFQ